MIKQSVPTIKYYYSLACMCHLVRKKWDAQKGLIKAKNEYKNSNFRSWMDVTDALSSDVWSLISFAYLATISRHVEIHISKIIKKSCMKSSH